MAKSRKLVAVDEAVGVTIRKSVIINNGREAFREAWDIVEERIALDSPGKEVRDVSFSDEGDALNVVFRLAEVSP